jgi:hypothetical protein
LAVYPNPFSEVLTVRLSAGMEDRVRVDLIDVTGRLALSETSLSGSIEHVLHLQAGARQFAPGVYLLRATIGRNVSNRLVTFVRSTH